MANTRSCPAGGHRRPADGTPPFALLDAAKTADVLLYLIAAVAAVDDRGHYLLTLLRSQGLVPGIVGLTNVDRVDAKRAAAMKKDVVRYLHTETAEEMKGLKRQLGDIAAVLALKNTFTGDTLCDPDKPIALENISFPDPVIHIAIEPKSTADQDKMGEALRRLAEEDPTFKVRTDEQTGQTIIGGMGELHLEVLVDRMLREYKVQANVGRPRVAYRESVTKSVQKVDLKYAKQSGGHGQYAHIVIAVEPGDPGSGITFENDIVGGSIPKEFINPVEKGIREAAENGVLAGYPVVDVKVTLFDGSAHDVDSSEMAFKIAGSMAFKDGVMKAGPVLLEPMMQVEVIAPEEYTGDVLGDLSSRRASIESMEPRIGNVQAVKAKVPLAEMFGYATDIRSKTQGRGVYSMEFDHYAQVPANVAEQVLSGKNKK